MMTACYNLVFKLAAPVDDADKPVQFSSYGLSIGSKAIYLTGKSDTNIRLTAKVSPSSRQNLAGTGLWKMTIFGSKEDNPDTTGPRLDYQEQILNEETRNMPIQDGADLLFNVKAKFELGKMNLCEGSYQYFCVLLTKGESPDPDF